jgi:RNase P/RNase MRP subunit POP5
VGIQDEQRDKQKVATVRRKELLCFGSKSEAKIKPWLVKRQEKCQLGCVVLENAGMEDV